MVPAFTPPTARNCSPAAAILSAEKRVLDAAGRTDGRRAPARAVDMALLEQKATRGRALNPGQAAVVREMACSGARVQLALAPAGSGKTTAMAALTRAWEESGGRVLGLSPGANQAQLLRDDINTDTDTVDKFIWLHRNPDATDDPARAWFDAIDESTLIIVDEAGKAGTLQLDAVITTALARGASVRLVGDDQQLASISAGGVLRDIDATYGALNLTEVVRFKSRAEAQAGLALREGDPSGLAFYADNHRIHVGSDDDDHRHGLPAAGPPTTPADTTPRCSRPPTRSSPSSTNAPAWTAWTHKPPTAHQRRCPRGRFTRSRVGRRPARLGRRHRRHPPQQAQPAHRPAEDFVRNGYRWRVDERQPTTAGSASRRLDTGQKATPAGLVRPQLRHPRLRLDHRLLPGHDHRQQNDHRHLPRRGLRAA